MEPLILGLPWSRTVIFFRQLDWLNAFSAILPIFRDFRRKSAMQHVHQGSTKEQDKAFLKLDFFR
jgi:hypothetical protein